jgi:hypothetical protein
VNQLRSAVPYVIAIVTGMALWFAASMISGRREAWDAGIYWVVFYPIAILGCGVLGYLFPERPWRWALVLFLAQFVAMGIRNGEVGNLSPIGLIVFAILSLPGIAAARFASSVRKKHSH